MADLSTAKKMEEWLTKPIVAGLVSYGISVALGEGAWQMNLGPMIGTRDLPVAMGAITAATTLVTGTVAVFLMPYITPHFAVSNAVFLPLVAAGVNYGAVKLLAPDYDAGYKPLIEGAAGEVVGAYVEQNILLQKW